MKTIKFHKSECGVDFLLNILSGEEHLHEYYNEIDEAYNTDFFEILFFIKGSGILMLNQHTIEIKNNTVIFISAFQKRQWKIDLQKSEFMTLLFQEDFLNDFFADKFFITGLLYFYQLSTPLTLSLAQEQMNRYTMMLDEIKEELQTTKQDSAHIIRSLIYYILQTLNREYAKKNQLSLKKPDNNYSYQFKILLEKHIKEKQRIIDYTDMMNISRISLNKSVKDQFGITANDLIKQRLLFEIKNEIAYSGKTITEIAFDLHFSAPVHLMRFFKKMTGMTTTEFINSSHQQMKLKNS
ncbi:helix-turn-helix domain-containing protein [Chryseobacterium sp. HR92]|uniref:helix-turn-helix domain-containing protein n=1 Tax=Chryseobacterium sp. HR92 TaxID=3094839 RepID=UPI00388EBFD7|nr:helix-turn-helix transcriptional regulator [Chryseobacterium sp. HR92]